MTAACNEWTRIVFICTPNNPTGTSVERRTIETVLEHCAGKCVVVVDEAYIEFSGNTSAVELANQYDNLVVLRTLSKALAFAGARCGAVMGACDVIDLLDAIQAPYALATPVVECVENALQSRCMQEAEQQTAKIIAERARLVSELQTMKFVRHIWPSDANFFLMQVADSAAVREKVRADRVLLRYFGGDLSDCVRVSVGTAGENDQLLDSLRCLGE